VPDYRPKSPDEVRREENIAGVVAAFYNDTDRISLDSTTGRLSDALGGQIGLLRYLIGAADALTAAETRLDATVDSWYDALDTYGRFLITRSPASESELAELAERALRIAACSDDEPCHQMDCPECDGSREIYTANESPERR